LTPCTAPLALSHYKVEAGQPIQSCAERKSCDFRPLHSLSLSAGNSRLLGHRCGRDFSSPFNHLRASLAISRGLQCRSLGLATKVASPDNRCHPIETAQISPGEALGSPVAWIQISTDFRFFATNSPENFALADDRVLSCLFVNLVRHSSRGSLGRWKMVKAEKPPKRRRIVRKTKQEPPPLDQKSGNRNGLVPPLPFRIMMLIKRLRNDSSDGPSSK